METWKKIKHFEYEVSDAGNVRSLLTKEIVRQRYISDGYAAVNLPRHGGKVQFYVHYLVLCTFSGEPAKGRYCCHNDGNIKNNNISNLRFDTAKNNIADKKLHGTHKLGTQVLTSKLNEEAVKVIKFMLRKGVSQKKLAELHKVGKTTIYHIAHKHTWKQVILP